MVTIDREVVEPPGEVVLVRFGSIEHMFPGVLKMRNWHWGSFSVGDPVGGNQNSVFDLLRVDSIAALAAQTDVYSRERDSGPFLSGPGHHSAVGGGQNLWFPEQAIL